MIAAGQADAYAQVGKATIKNVSVVKFFGAIV